MIFSLLLAFAAINLKADQTIGGTALNHVCARLRRCYDLGHAGPGPDRHLRIPTWVRIDAGAPSALPRCDVNQASANNLSSRSSISRSPVAMRSVHRGLHCAVQDPLRPASARLRRASSGGGLRGHQCLQDALRRRDHLRLPGRHRRPGLRAGGGSSGFNCRRRRLRLPCPGCHDLRQLETTARFSASSLFFALFKVIAAYYFARLSFLPKFRGCARKVSNFYQMLPYIVTMIVLIFTSKNSQAPKAEGIPYDKGSR